MKKGRESDVMAKQDLRKYRDGIHMPRILQSTVGQGIKVSASRSQSASAPSKAPAIKPGYNNWRRILAPRTNHRKYE